MTKRGNSDEESLIERVVGDLVYCGCSDRGTSRSSGSLDVNRRILVSRLVKLRAGSRFVPHLGTTL